MLNEQRFIRMPFYSVGFNGVSCYSRSLDTHTGEYYKPGKGRKVQRPKENKDKYSKKSAKALRNKVAGLLYMTDERILLNGTCRSKVVFVTLTLPFKQCHSDKVIKSECLNQLLIELTQKFQVKHYIWKAERQKNGNLHFHLLINKYVPHQVLREMWNRVLNKLGYIDKFYKKFGHRSPNSTDIHSLYKDKRTGKKVGNVAAYISKYMGKDDLQIEGRYWFCSRAVSSFAKSVCLGEETNEFYNEFGAILEYSNENTFAVSDEHFVYCSLSLSRLRTIAPTMFNIFTSVLSGRMDKL